MTQIVFPVLYALFVWWFSTGLIMYLDGLPPRTFRWSMAGAGLVLVGSLIGVAATGADTSVAGAYLGFSFALGLWAWQEMGFYTGWITGPRRVACPHGCAGWRHFRHAVETTLWHEMSILATFAILLWLQWGAANKVALWSFAVLWGMHESARINVVLGVRNLNEHFLPEHLAYLRRFLRRRAMNLLFPVSATLGAVVSTLLVRSAYDATGEFERTGLVFVATMAVLGLLEHWVLVLPLPFQALWTWSLKSRLQRRTSQDSPAQRLAPDLCDCGAPLRHPPLQTTGETL